MIGTVARHEFLSTVKRKSYYLVTLGMPLIVGAYALVIGIVSAVSASGELAELAKPVGVIDESGILTGPAGPLHDVPVGATYQLEPPSAQPSELEKQLERFSLPTGRQQLLRLADLDDAAAALRDESIRSVVVVPADYVPEGTLHVYVRERRLTGTTTNTDFLQQMLAGELLRQAQLDDATARRVQQRARLSEFEFGPDGQFVEVRLLEKAFRLGVPMAVSILLLIALMMNASLLLASVAEEKENRVIEVILSSVPADTLLFGKVIGLVAAGVLQILVWLAMVSVVPALTMRMLRQVVAFEVPTGQLAIGVLFILLGFVFYGCLLAGIGSLGSTYKDSQQLTVIVIMFPMVPMMLMGAFVSAPNGIVPRILSWLPLCSPCAMMLRLGLASVPTWEVVGSLVLLLASIWWAVRFSARLFRIGTLLYGKRPSIRQILTALAEPL